jgi:hypothetical protein
MAPEYGEFSAMMSPKYKPSIPAMMPVIVYCNLRVHLESVRRSGVEPPFAPAPAFVVAA